MGLNKFYALGVIGIYFGIEECFPERGDIHKKRRSMSNAKVQISNQIQSSNVKSPKPPLLKGGGGGSFIGFETEI